jgi:ATP-dependent DNA helicase RecG
MGLRKNNDNVGVLDKNQRISLRDKIFREVVSNILIHREFANPFPAKFVIEKDKVFTENSNKPHGHGIIDPDGHRGRFFLSVIRIRRAIITRE